MQYFRQPRRIPSSSSADKQVSFQMGHEAEAVTKENTSPLRF